MINDRIGLLVKHLSGGNKCRFAKDVEVAPSVISNITGIRQNKPSYEVMRKIVVKFDKVNPKWLLTGEGDMLLEGKKNCTVEKYTGEDKIYKEMLREKDAVIVELSTKIGRLTERIENCQGTDKDFRSELSVQSEQQYLPLSDATSAEMLNDSSL